MVDKVLVMFEGSKFMFFVFIVKECKGEYVKML